MLPPKKHMNVVMNFHKGDQYSAMLLLNLLSVVDEEIDCTYYLQYGDELSTLTISETIFKFLSRKKAFFSSELPEIRIPKDLIKYDTNQVKCEGTHSMITVERKKSVFAWNLCIYKYIQKLDNFLSIEPDSVVLKDGWLSDIYEGWKNYSGPIFGHLKKGKIDGNYIATHWAGSSVYNSEMLRELPLEKYFYERYSNPWWPYRNLKDTETLNNCFWGPMFSAYDVSYDYFLFALYWREKTGENDPYKWPIDTFSSREDLIYCDFMTKMTVDDIFENYAGELPHMHGIKGDEIRERMIKYFSKKNISNSSSYFLSGPSSGLIDRDNTKLFNIKDLKNKFSGKRCFIIGNGPSLKKTNMNLLRDEYTIGVNRIYLNYDNMGFEPTFYCCVNPNVVEQFSEEIDSLNSIKFIRKESKELLRNSWNTFFVESLSGGHKFNKDFEFLGWYEGWTVTYCAMQLAHYLGFDVVILIGVDHYFKNSGEPNKLVTARGSDENHFSPDYFGQGVNWQYPDLDNSEKSYKVAKKVYEEDGRIILDATVGGQLKVFSKANYLSVVKRSFKYRLMIRLHSVLIRTFNKIKTLSCLIFHR